MMDFSLEYGAAFGYGKIVGGSRTICGQIFNYMGTTAKNPNDMDYNESDEYYFENLGYGEQYNMELMNAAEMSDDTYLIQAIINDTTGVKYYRDSDTTSITTPTFSIINDTMLISFQIKHPKTAFNYGYDYLSRGEGVCFTDSVLVYSYYVKDNSIKANSPVVASRAFRTSNFTAKIKLDSIFFKEGDSLLFKIKTKDKGIIPEYELFPSGGYYKLVFDTLIAGVNDKRTNSVYSYKLEQNYPNPFNPSTTISYQMPKSSKVSLKIYNMLGQEVATLVNAYMEAGAHSVTFNAGKLASGVYLYKLDAGSFSLSRKMILAK